MASIYISLDAVRKIMERMDFVSSDSENAKVSQIPLLVWSHRTYSTPSADVTIEHGPLLYLTTIKPGGINECVVVTLNNGATLGLRPKEKFSTGVHEIGLAEGRFTLRSNK